MNMAAGLCLEPPGSSRKEKEGAQTLGVALACCDSHGATLGGGDIAEDAAGQDRTRWGWR